MRNNIVLIDLRKASLQVCVDPSIWKQNKTVRWKNRYYYLTSLGFGLSSAPKIMPKILKKLLSLDVDVSSGTNAYIDDIVVNCDMVNPSQVMDHLVMHGLITKQPEKIEKAKSLGLLITEINMGQLLWSRDNELP